jgi:hypothetical protein
MCLFSCEVFFLISDFNQNLRVLTNFSKIPRYEILLKSVQWFRTYADMAKLIGGFFLQLIVM